MSNTMNIIDNAGIHIIMDARVLDPSVFTSENLTSLFGKIIQSLDMKPLDKIKIYEVPVNPRILERMKLTGDFEDEGGVSAIQVISTSHLSCHVWPLQGYFAFDIFSCKTYDVEQTLSIIRDAFGVTAENITIIERKKPRNLENSIKHHVQASHRGISPF